MKSLFLTLLLLISLHSFSQGSPKNGDVGKYLHDWIMIYGNNGIYINDSPRSYQNYLTLKLTVNKEDYNRHKFIDSLIASIKDCGYIAKMNKCTLIYVTIRTENIFRKKKRILYVSPEGKIYYDKDFKVEL